MSRTSPTGCSKIILPDLARIAIQTRLVIRRSNRFSAEAFLHSLLFSVVSGQGSLNQIVASLKDRVARSMSRQSLWERFSSKSTAFLQCVLCELMEQRFQPVAATLKTSSIRRLILEDASGKSLPKSNAGHFPAHGNHHGQTAGVKINFAYDLLDGTMVSQTLEQATTQDKSIAKETVPHLTKGDLLVRDMGYFSLDEFTAIEERGARWLTRLPLTTGVTLEDGTVLEKRLKTTTRNIVDLGVFAGKQRKRCRLIAIRADKKVAEQRRRERRKKAKDNGKTACKDALVRDGWHLMLTNLLPAEASAMACAGIYRARWAVEIQFRAWKQSLNLGAALNRKSNEHHLQALVLAAMIAHQLGMRVGAVFAQKVGWARLSFEKLYDILAQHLLSSKSLEALSSFHPDTRHITRDKRIRKSPIEAGITALT